MLCDKNVLIIGGDRRFLFLGELLKKRNRVSFLGFEKQKGGQNNISFDEATSSCYDYIVLPVPSFKDGFVNSPFSALKISCENVLSLIKQKTVLLGAMLPDDFLELASKYKVEYFDYFLREELTVANAWLTAEGAVAIAVSESDFSLFGADVLVMGYGRIGKALSHILKGYGARTDVSARKASDFAWIRAFGHTAINTADIKEHIGKYDIIFNTIPKPLLNKEALSLVKDNCLIIDLASLPGGADKAFAKEKGIKLIHALGLPAKVSPKEAGKIIMEAIENIEKERSESLE